MKLYKYISCKLHKLIIDHVLYCSVICQGNCIKDIDNLHNNFKIISTNRGLFNGSISVTSYIVENIRVNVIYVDTLSAEQLIQLLKRR